MVLPGQPIRDKASPTLVRCYHGNMAFPDSPSNLMHLLLKCKRFMWKGATVPSPLQREQAMETGRHSLGARVSKDVALQVNLSTPVWGQSCQVRRDLVKGNKLEDTEQTKAGCRVCVHDANSLAR